MTEISSYKIQLTQTLSTHDIVELHQFASLSDCTFYLYRENAIADAANLPKLLSFFFLTPETDQIVIIVDGPNAEEAYNELEQLLENQVKKAEQRTFHKVQDGASVVI
ncbi:HPr family phosphocarrier protein [Virgibacillus kekensis]|uniref:HPr family phosphocarrier protein n=1 Tax=Virgibacillus kekensis TaxID=202261 RepID=A0ABV9DDR8_9BACI